MCTVSFSPSGTDSMTLTITKCRWLAVLLLIAAGFIAVHTLRRVSFHISEPIIRNGRGRRSLVLEAFELTAARARERLALDNGVSTDAFGSVDVSLPLPAAYLRIANGEGGGQLMKTFAGEELLRTYGKQCIVYGIGIAHTLLWEVKMAQLGCTVHAFDCTSDVAALSAEAASTGVTFHPWCIGKQRPFEGNNYAIKKDSIYAFYTLKEVMEKLGHQQVDVLKMDIEGFEWQILEEEIIPALSPPLQILFELHTEGAKKEFVPQQVVLGRDRKAVNRAFMQLHDAGYRVVSKELNGGDMACAEFALVLL